VIEGWTARRKNVHLLFGGWYATALERYYRACAEGMESNDALCLVVRLALMSTRELEHKDGSWHLADVKFEDDSYTGAWRPWASDNNIKTRETLIRSIVWYVDQFEEDNFETVTLANGKPAVELTFTLDLDNGLVLVGKLDRLVKYGDDIYVMDQKTTRSTITQRYFEGWSPDTQMSAYTFAGQALYKLPVKGVILDAAQIAVGFTRFERGFVFRSKAQLEEWYESSLYHINAAREATASNRFPMNRSSCSHFGGCEFRHICSRSPEVREQFLKGDFQKEDRR